MTVEYTDSDWTENRESKWDEDVRLASEMVPRVKAAVEDYLGKPVNSVLEVGCGSGFMGAAFESAGCEYTGTEVDTTSIEHARSHGIDVHCVEAETMAETELKGRQFDLIISSNVFEHLDNPLLSFQNLRPLCRGAIVIIVPNALGLYQRLRANTFVRGLIHRIVGTNQERAYSIDGCWHNIAYSRETLQYMCDHSDLQAVKIRPMSINDPVFGFVQPNLTLKYRAAAGLARILSMDSELLLIAKPK